MLLALSRAAGPFFFTYHVPKEHFDPKTILKKAEKIFRQFFHFTSPDKALNI